MLDAMLLRSMAASLAAVTGLALCAMAAQAKPSGEQQLPPGMYQNPLDVHIADPDVLLYQGVYYLYGTSAGDGFKVWTSRDLAHWQPRGYAFRRTKTSWGRGYFWAPGVIAYHGAFYMFYSSHGPVDGGKRKSLRICVARSDSPLGPFVDLKAPLLDVGKATIDAQVFIDDNGRAYLYYSLDISENGQSQIWVVGLDRTLTKVITRPILCIKPSQKWEGTKWNEAPYVFKTHGVYVLMYSANAFYDPRYAVGYATAISPLGPWIKADDNPLLHRTKYISGPGHNAVVKSPDGKQLWLVYHVQSNIKGGSKRVLAIDRLKVVKEIDGSVRLATNGPTHTPQPLPSGSPIPEEKASSHPPQ